MFTILLGIVYIAFASLMGAAASQYLPLDGVIAVTLIAVGVVVLFGRRNALFMSLALIPFVESMWILEFALFR